MIAKTTICALAAAVIVALMTSSSEAHSWIDCTDWRITKNGAGRWSEKNGICVAWARKFPVKMSGGKQIASHPFGSLDNVDPFRHYQQDPKDFLSCADGKHGREAGSDESRTSPITKSYGGKFGVMATAAPGQEICLRWPAKNHAVPDETLMAKRSFVFYDPKPVVSGSSDPTEPAFYGQYPGFGKDPKNKGGPSFNGEPKVSGNPYFIKEIAYNNCTLGIANTDRTPCGGCFTVPSNVKPGDIHMFHWRWQLNPNEFYTSCWDIKITQPGGSGKKHSVAGGNSTTFSELETLL